MKKRPSLKAEWKNDARALDLADAPERARSVFTAIWAHTDTDTVNNRRVAMVWAKVSTLRSQTGIPNDKAVMRALDWLVEHGFIWRAAPRKNSRATVQVGSETRTLDRGVNVYAYIARASTLSRARWARGTYEAFGDRLDGGPTLAAALAVDLEGIDNAVRATKARVFNEAVDAVVARRVKVSGLTTFVEKALAAAARGASAELTEALSGLNAASIAAEAEDVTAAPDRRSQAPVAKGAA